MDIDAIRKLYDVDGPFVSIYLNTRGDVEQAAAELELRWKNLLRDLADRGVDAATRDALTAARGSHALGGTRVMFAANGAVHLATSLPPEPAREIVEIGPLPHVLPLLDAMTLNVPHLVVLIDREGADVLAYRGVGQPVADTEAIEGPDQAHVHKVSAGGWSSQGNQNATDTEWHHNAKTVAERTTGLAAQLGAELVLVGGDTRALTYFETELPQRVRDRLVIIEATRARDGSDEHIGERVLEAVNRHLEAATRTLLQRFAEERAQRDRACEGVADTVEALRKAQVGTLILSQDFDPQRAGWFGPTAPVLGLDRDELAALGTEPREARLVDILPWATLGTGAELRVISADEAVQPREGVGALLRYAD